MIDNGLITKDELNIIQMSDDIDEVITMVDDSLKLQLSRIKEMGLESSNYGNKLKEILEIRGLV